MAASTEAVCSGDDLEANQVLDRLAALVDKSMVIVGQQPGEQARYRLLEMVRQYAREKLREAGTSGRLNQRHYEYFLRFAEANGPKVWYKDRPAWLRKFEADHENVVIEDLGGIARPPARKREDLVEHLKGADQPEQQHHQQHRA